MRLLFSISSLLLAGLLLPVGWGSAGDLFPHRQRLRTKPCLPPHDYDQGVWPYAASRSFKATAIAVAATDPTIAGQQVKPFHFRVTELTLDQLTLDQVGISLYRLNGQLFATGRISHNGGNGGLIGNNVTIRVRAFVAQTAATASPNEATRIPSDAYVVWTSEHNLWIPRGGPHSISLIPPKENSPNNGNLANYFVEITHLEVELEYKRDR